MKVVCILLLMFQTNVISTCINEVSSYSQFENIINTLVPQHHLTQDDIDNLKAQVKLWKELDHVIHQPMNNIEYLNSQLILISTYIDQNINMVFNEKYNPELAFLYLNMNNKNFELRTKIFNMVLQLNLKNINELLQSQNISDSQCELFDYNNLLVLSTLQNEEYAYNQANLNNGQINSASIIDTVTIPSTNQNALLVQPVKIKDNINEVQHNMPTNKSLHVEDMDVSEMHMNLDSVQSSSQVQPILHNIDPVTNSKIDQYDTTITENNSGSELQEEIAASNSSLSSKKCKHYTFKLYRYKLLYKKYGTEGKFNEQAMIDEFMKDHSRTKKLSYEMARVLAKKMCSETDILRNDNGKYKFISEEAYNINVGNKLLKVEKIGKVYIKRVDLLNYIASLYDELKEQKSFSRKDIYDVLQKTIKTFYLKDKIEIIIDKVLELAEELLLIKDSENNSYEFVKEVKPEYIHPILIKLNKERLFELIKKCQRLKKEFSVSKVKQCIFSGIKMKNNTFIENMLNELIDDRKIRRIEQNRKKYSIYSILNNN